MSIGEGEVGVTGEVAPMLEPFGGGSGNQGCLVISDSAKYIVVVSDTSC